jgi:glycosyltransferase involved in cell wall biosynthesis
MKKYNKSKNKIAWITSAGLVETDIHVVPDLMQRFDIDWYVIKDTCESLDYENELSKFSGSRSGLKIIKLEGKRFGVKRIQYYRTFVRKLAEYDLIYTVIFGIPYYVPLLKFGIKDKKVIVAVHNVNLLKGITHPIAKRVYQKMVFKFFGFFDTFSKSQCELLKKIETNKKVFYTPFMLKDYGVAKKDRTDNRVTFLCYGNIKEYKRHDLVIHAAQALYEKGITGFKVLIAGEGAYWETCKADIKYSELFDLRIARVRNEEVADLFNETDYLVMPYQDIAQSGAAIVGVNYGVPIIASDLDAFREYIVDGENGYLIAPTDAHALEDAMEKCITGHIQNYDKMHDNMIRVRNNEFSKENVIRAYSEMIDSVLKE